MPRDVSAHSNYYSPSAVSGQLCQSVAAGLLYCRQSEGGAMPLRLVDPGIADLALFHPA